MADLNLIKYLNIRYNKDSVLSIKFGLQRLLKIFKDESTDLETKGFDPMSLAALGQNFVTYFEKGATASVGLLFIDVCNFSTRFSNFTGEEISKYFDEYYQLIIPIIYKHGGEIEKIIGDGMIVVFGQPFLDRHPSELLAMTDACAKEILKTTVNTKFSSKIAYHFGKINYFKNKSGFYDEYTVIGKPLTELFRLENVSEDDCINYFYDSATSAYYNQAYDLLNADYNGSGEYRFMEGQNWRFRKRSLSNLKGVADFTEMIQMSLWG